MIGALLPHAQHEPDPRGTGFQPSHQPNEYGGYLNGRYHRLRRDHYEFQSTLLER